jgi:hypothetical protein
MLLGVVLWLGVWFISAEQGARAGKARVLRGIRGGGVVVKTGCCHR